ncbi:MAG: DUF4080 domain-containing protein [Erysipelotrichaceae bacterium]|nr:DUF4080 domain-containing protein [Erysipelotrichaceae bacterium]
MKILLTTLNAKYIHKNLALRWLYVTRPDHFDVEIKEFTINDDLVNVIEAMTLEKYDVVGISVYIWNSEKTKILIDHIKTVNPNIRVILGGPEVSFDNDEWFDHAIEAIVVGEGERVFWEYLLGNTTESIKTIKEFSPKQAVVDLVWLEKFESPYYLAFDLPTINERYLYLETSRGCPYRCQYCLSSIDNHVRFFSLDYVDKVLLELNKYQIRQVKFLDRTFNVNENRAITLLSKLNELDNKSNYHLELVADTISESMLSYICHDIEKSRFRFEIGVQSFNTETLMAIKRQSNIERLKRVISMIANSGLYVHADLIAGLPYEDISSFKESYDQLFFLFTQEIQVGILKLLKGTPLKVKAKQYQMLYDDKAPYLIKSTAWLNNDDLQKIMLVDLATEKLYNNHKLRHTVIELVSYHNISPFELMALLGEVVSQLKKPYQNKELFLKLFDSLKTIYDEELIKGLLLFDYYRYTKQRPTRLFYTDKRYKDIEKIVLDQMIIDEQTLYNYSMITPIIYQNNHMYQLVLYNDQQGPSVCYLINSTNGKVSMLI